MLEQSVRFSFLFSVRFAFVGIFSEWSLIVNSQHIRHSSTMSVFDIETIEQQQQM